MNEVEKILNVDITADDGETFMVCRMHDKCRKRIAQAIDAHYKEQWKEVFEVYWKFGVKELENRDVTPNSDESYEDMLEMWQAIKTCVGRCGDEGNI